MSALSCYLEEEESEEKKGEEITPLLPPCSSRVSGDPQHMKKSSIRSQVASRCRYDGISQIWEIPIWQGLRSFVFRWF